MLEVLEKDKCCGCSACFSACGHHAITMQLDSEGFEYPIISQEECVDCGLCQSVCPVLQYENRKDIRIKIVMYRLDFLHEIRILASV